MKILQISPFLGEQFGGTERFCWNLSKTLVQQGQEVSIFTSKTDWRSDSNSKFQGVNIQRFYAPRIIWGINPLAIMFPSITANNMDLIHVHSYLYFVSNQAVLSKFLRSLAGYRTPMIMHLHGGIGTPQFLKKSPFRKVIKRIYDKIFGKLSMIVSEKVIAVSESDAANAIETFNIPSRKIEIIPNAIDMTQFSFNNTQVVRDEKQRRRIIFIGDLERWKGVETLVEAMGILKRIDPSFSLEMIGQGSLRHKLESRARSQGFPIRFLGEINHKVVPKLLTGAYSLVLPSLWEGLPTVVLEAMASGVPVIATRVGGIPEVITDTVNGQLVEPNAPKEIVRGILALENEPFREKITTNAYELIKSKYDIQQVAKKITKLYQSII